MISNVRAGRQPARPRDKERPFPHPEQTFKREEKRRKDKRPFFNGNCDACGRLGHKATCCNYLAMHVILTRNMKHLSSQVVQAAEDEWVKKNAKWLEDREAKHTPCRVAAVYCQRLPLEECEIDAQMNWDFFKEWPEDEPLPPSL